MGIALVGCGRWGRNLARNLMALGELRMIVDPFLSESQLPDGVSAPIERHLSAALESDSIAGVVIAAPAVDHAQLAKKALLAGKHVFVEKPLAMTVDDAEEIAALARERALTLMVGHLLQYHPGFLRLKQGVRAGEIGMVRHIASNRLNPGAIRSEENALWSLAPHDFSMILGLAGSYPEAVSSLAIEIVTPGLPDRFVTSMKFANSVTATADVSWLSPYKEHRLTVLGEKGALILDDHAADPSRRLMLYKDFVDRTGAQPAFRKTDGESLPFDPKEPLRAEMEAFVSATRGQPDCVTGPEEAIPVLRLLTEASKATTWG
ncbi:MULTISPECIES: Gfo/Idh/MocA family protein [Brevundimonas]|uniref:Gfo/Idh/MocA family protein n=1 Tax=Brevundimonas TaxID=41275 RepID=UPI0005ED41A2|nr:MULTISPECIES: Gfo/Idh/MocA family oxidoreductase [Brevundimonas]